MFGKTHKKIKEIQGLKFSMERPNETWPYAIWNKIVIFKEIFLLKKNNLFNIKKKPHVYV
jgi:hypothetical protein